MTRSPANRSSLRSVFELLHALDGDQLVLHYQPIVDLRSDFVESREALVRWQHPELGLLGPDMFLGLAENRWLGWRLTDWVLHQAFADCAEWRSTGDRAGVSINVLPHILKDDWLIAAVQRHLSETRLPPEVVTIEVTERQWPEDPEASYRVLESVRRLGVRVSLDDFGTGHSSLSHLQRVRFDEVKIDRSFVVRAVENEADRQIVAYTCDLVRALGRRTVAEGLERHVDLDLVRELSVDAGQGYLLGAPAPIAS